MMRLHGGLPAAAALIAIALAGAGPAAAKVKMKHHHMTARAQPTAHRPVDFPVYVDHGSDRNPGGDNLYFTDTKDPHYVVGPAWFQRWEDR